MKINDKIWNTKLHFNFSGEKTNTNNKNPSVAAVLLTNHIIDKTHYFKDHEFNNEVFILSLFLTLFFILKFQFMEGIVIFLVSNSKVEI